MSIKQWAEAILTPYIKLILLGETPMRYCKLAATISSGKNGLLPISGNCRASNQEDKGRLLSALGSLKLTGVMELCNMFFPVKLLDLAFQATIPSVLMIKLNQTDDVDCLLNMLALTRIET